MPTTYAHWRFGKDCIETLPKELQIIISENRELFDIGVHGPDIFFYDLRHKEIPKFGSNMHKEKGRVFFEKAVETYKKYDDEKDAMLAYILGFLSHYTLDAKCHAYINTKVEKSAVSHNKIEAEYDGYLMRKEGFKVNDVSRSKSLKPNKFTTKIISRFFPLSEKEIMRTTRGQKLIIGLLNSSSDTKRKTMTRLTQLIKRSDYTDLIVGKDELEICKDSNLRIDKLKDEAIKLYPVLTEQIIRAINNNEELKEGFDWQFDPPADDNIPVLSYEEELNYQP